MISPATLRSRALAILAAAPEHAHTTRLPADASPALRAARAAWHAHGDLVHARYALRIYRRIGRMPIPSFRWNVEAYRPEWRLCRACLRAAAKYLAEAEAILAAAEMKEAA